MTLLFFFSSRRRHTRLTCDWSSDVCSSDLDEDADDHQGGNDSRGEWTTHGKAALVERLVDEVADRRTEWPCENERGPEQEHPGYVGPEIGCRQCCQSRPEDEGSALITEACIGNPIAKCGSESL